LARLALLGLFLASIGAGAALAFYQLLTTPVELAHPITLTIEAGESPQDVARRLEQHGVVRNSGALVVLARIRGLDRDIKLGEHVFEGSLTPDDVLRELVRNTTSGLRVTIPEGLTWRETGVLLEEAGVVSADEYYAAVCDPDLMRRAWIAPEGNCAEGYLFPDTYRLDPSMSAAEIARLQVERFLSVARAVLAETPRTTENSILTAKITGATLPFGVLRTEEPYVEILRAGTILASVIEKETGIESERPLVASVFHNRLKIGMRLQADPTVIYGLELAAIPYDRARLHEHLRAPGPYNSYTNAGLPPGPICNPGESALRAAFGPIASRHLYFVANGDGSHQFSNTLVEHNRAVAEFRRRIQPAS
jgi:UPF0755 protein